MSISESKTIQKKHFSNSNNRQNNQNPSGKAIIALFVSIVLLCIFIMSTSYYSRHEEMQLIENQYFLPEYIKVFEESFTNSGDNLCIEVEDETLYLSRTIRRFYSEHDFFPVFTTYKDLNGNGSELLELLKGANSYGLEPDHYHVHQISDLQKKLQQPELKQQHIQIRKDLELLLADAAMKFMMHLNAGYRLFDSVLFMDPYMVSLPETLTEAIYCDNFREKILSCQPSFIEYVRLQQATEKFVNQVELGDNWIKIYDLQEDSILLWSGIGEVLKRLGYLVHDTSYTGTCNALKTFQKFHGLEPEGKIDDNTLEALSQSTLYKYRMLALNLDRLRKQEQHESHMLFINIPAYNLKVIRENEIERVYRVCVGKTYSPTPRIDGDIEQIVINPEWNVPKRIARNEILPRIKSDMDYLQRNRFNILDEKMNTVSYEQINWDTVSSDNFNYYIQQNPSNDNALGQVKFVFKNSYSIYLHDTPNKSLFFRDIRAFSHGCIRVQDSEELAAYLVEQLQSDAIDINELICYGDRYEINLEKTIPVQIRYITCTGDEKGNLYYYKDIYGLDKREMDDFLNLASL